MPGLLLLLESEEGSVVVLCETCCSLYNWIEPHPLFRGGLEDRSMDAMLKHL